MRAYESGINWTWFLEFDEIEKDVIRITRHYRIHNESLIHINNHPISSGKFRLVENKDRIVTGVYIDGEFKLVENEKHIFDYKG